MLLAMSGGVDSSVAAALLMRQGHRVLGATMRLGNAGDESAIADARAVARQLGLEHRVVDLRDTFRREVIGDFLREYALGRTPNPCVRCNRRLKFGALWTAAAQFGADRLATGHYARVTVDDATGRCELRKGRDERKDQSYVLYTLTQRQLSRTLLPLGELTKREVRALADELRLPVADKAESQDVCFIPDGDCGRYLREHCPSALQGGDVVDLRGKVLGQHEGVALYTVGQRRGLGIAAETPRYVVRLDAANHRVIVGEGGDVWSRGLIASGVNWIAGGTPSTLVRATVKIRYNHAGGAATLTPIGNERVRVDFDAPQRAVAPGQSAVFFAGDTVLGGGVIDESVRGEAE